MFSSAKLWGDLHQIAPLLIIWLTASVILLGDVFSNAPGLRAIWQGRKDMNPILAIAGVIAATGTYFTQAQSGDQPIFARALKIDDIASMSGIALLIGALLSILMAWTYLKNRDLDHGEYYVLLLLSTSGAMVMASANDLIVLFLGLEVLSFALYVMAGFARTEERSEEASIKYFLLGAFASAFLLYGIALLY